MNESYVVGQITMLALVFVIITTFLVTFVKCETVLAAIVVLAVSAMAAIGVMNVFNDLGIDSKTDVRDALFPKPLTQY